MTINDLEELDLEQQAAINKAVLARIRSCESYYDGQQLLCEEIAKTAGIDPEWDEKEHKLIRNHLAYWLSDLLTNAGIPAPAQFRDYIANELTLVSKDLVDFQVALLSGHAKSVNEGSDLCYAAQKRIDALLVVVLDDGRPKQSGGPDSD
jgi:hypothetical protein